MHVSVLTSAELKNSALTSALRKTQMSDDQHFYITILLKDGEIIGHTAALEESDLQAPDTAPREPSKKGEGTDTPTGDPKTFEQVFSSFASVVTTYRNFLQFTLALAPMISRVMAQRSIGAFAKSKGIKRDDLSTTDRHVFELKLSTWREFGVYQDDIVAAMRGAAHLPEVMIIGLVSAYDAFLGKLLKVIFLRNEGMILTSEKTIKFSDLSHFKSIEEARQALIDREIESVLRESHQDHFKWMEGKFGIRLKSDLPIFPRFIELCERRNLLTHTGGIVSAQYLSNCKSHGVNLKDVALGSNLTVTPAYYSTAVDVVCEIGIKLCYVLWRKFAKDERENADTSVNEFCYDLIVRRNYATAEAILSFSTKVLSQRGNDRCRRMMLINQANAIRLQKRSGEATKLLDMEDWSAVSDEFKVSVAAVRGDVDEVVILMNKIGLSGNPSAEGYRTWPVFRGMRTNPKFAAAFQSLFGEAVIHPKSTDAKLSITDEVSVLETELSETPSLH
jgi:hypothetical protein